MKTRFLQYVLECFKALKTTFLQYVHVLEGFNAMKTTFTTLHHFNVLLYIYGIQFDGKEHVAKAFVW